MSRSIVLAAACSTLALAAPASRAATLSVDDQGFIARMLVIHNRERAAVGAPPLTWDPMLAQSAASYGPALASLGRLQHSPRETRPGQRENLAMSSSGYLDDGQLAGLWVAEKNQFDRMKRREESGELFSLHGDRFTREKIDDVNERKVRRGRIGGYVDDMDADDIAYCDNLLRQYRYDERMKAALAI